MAPQGGGMTEDGETTLISGKKSMSRPYQCVCCVCVCVCVCVWVSKWVSECESWSCIHAERLSDAYMSESPPESHLHMHVLHRQTHVHFNHQLSSHDKRWLTNILHGIRHKENNNVPKDLRKNYSLVLLSDREQQIVLGLHLSSEVLAGSPGRGRQTSEIWVLEF